MSSSNISNVLTIQNSHPNMWLLDWCNLKDTSTAWTSDRLIMGYFWVIDKKYNSLMQTRSDCQKYEKTFCNHHLNFKNVFYLLFPCCGFWTLLCRILTPVFTFICWRRKASFCSLRHDSLRHLSNILWKEDKKVTVCYQLDIFECFIDYRYFKVGRKKST